MTADEEFELKSNPRVIARPEITEGHVLLGGDVWSPLRPKRGADLKSDLVVDSQTNAKDDLLKETEQKLEKLGNLMAIGKIQPKLKVVEKTIEPELTAIEKYLAQTENGLKAKQKIVAELKTEEKLKAQREDWRKLIKIQKAWVKSNLN